MLSPCHSALPNFQCLVIDLKMKSRWNKQPIRFSTIWFHPFILTSPLNTPRAWLNTHSLSSFTCNSFYLFKFYPTLQVTIKISIFVEDLSSYSKSSPFFNIYTCWHLSLIFAFCNFLFHKSVSSFHLYIINSWERDELESRITAEKSN